MKKVIEIMLLVVSMCVCMPLMAGASPFVHVIALVLVLLALGVPRRNVTTKNWNQVANGGVNIALTNGALGATLQTNDGIAGMVLTGYTGDSYTLGTPILVTSFAALGLGDNAITATNNEFAVRQVQDFFSNAGTGAQLYLMLVPDTMTVAQMALKTNANGAIKLLNYANGKVKVLGVMSDDTEVGVDTVTGINVDCYTAVTNMQALTVQFANAQKPLRGIVGGTSYSGTVGDVTDMTDGTADNRVALLIGDTESPDGYSAGLAACLGYLLGKIAVLPVQRKISRTADGPLSGVSAAYVGGETVEAAGGDMVTLQEKGIITFTTYANMAGYYFSSDPMCTATTDDYKFLAYGRVIDKAQILGYTAGVQLIDDEVPVIAGGLIDPGYATWLQQQFINVISKAMVANGNCSAVDCYVDPAQDIETSNTVDVVLKVRPVGYSSFIDIALGFEA